MDPGSSSDPFAYATWMMEMINHFGRHPGPVELTQYMYSHPPPRLPSITVAPSINATPVPSMLASPVRRPRLRASPLPRSPRRHTPTQTHSRTPSQVLSREGSRPPSRASSQPQSHTATPSHGYSCSIDESRRRNRESESGGCGGCFDGG